MCVHRACTCTCVGKGSRAKYVSKPYVLRTRVHNYRAAALMITSLCSVGFCDGARQRARTSVKRCDEAETAPRLKLTFNEKSGRVSLGKVASCAKVGIDYVFRDVWTAVILPSNARATRHFIPALDILHVYCLIFVSAGTQRFHVRKLAVFNCVERTMRLRVFHVATRYQVSRKTTSCLHWNRGKGALCLHRYLTWLHELLKH